MHPLTQHAAEPGSGGRRGRSGSTARRSRRSSPPGASCSPSGRGRGPSCSGCSRRAGPRREADCARVRQSPPCCRSCRCTPRGQWRASAQATWALAEDSLGAPPRRPKRPSTTSPTTTSPPSGPPRVSDMRTWLRAYRAAGPCSNTAARAAHLPRRARPRAVRRRGRASSPTRRRRRRPASSRHVRQPLLAHDDRSRVQAGLGPGLPVPRGGSIGPR